MSGDANRLADQLDADVTQAAAAVQGSVMGWLRMLRDTDPQRFQDLPLGILLDQEASPEAKKRLLERHAQVAQETS